ncbi:MAG: Bax inhibitor-1 family protein, partial [Planctomycetota bacterium]
SSTSIGKQYAGLVTYVVAQAVFFVPLLWFANQMSLELSDGTAIGLIPAAGVITLVMFGGLTAIAWVSGKDFSFLGAGLGIAGLAAFGLILVSALFGFNLGVWFSVAMVVFACAYILYDTSNVMHHYQPGQHVAASLSLFASVALLFWYVIRILMSFASND